MSKMKMYRTSKWFAAFVAVSCAAIGLLQFGFAEADPEGTEATTSTAGSGELRQRAKVLRPNDHGVGRLVADITFADLEGKQRSLAEFKSRKLVVFAMTSTSCPLSRKYLPTLTTLAQSYSANRMDSAVRTALEQIHAAAKAIDEVVSVKAVDATIHIGAKVTELNRSVGEQTNAFAALVSEKSDQLHAALASHGNLLRDALAENAHEAEALMSVSTSRILTDVTAALGKLNDSNILLQKVLDASTSNLANLETSVAQQTATYSSTVRDAIGSTEQAGRLVTEHVGALQATIRSMLDQFGSLLGNLNAETKSIDQAAQSLSTVSNFSLQTLEDRRGAMDSLAASFTARADDIDGRMRAFAQSIADTVNETERRLIGARKAMEDALQATTVTVADALDSTTSTVTSALKETAGNVTTVLGDTESRLTTALTGNTQRFSAALSDNSERVNAALAESADRVNFALTDTSERVSSVLSSHASDVSKALSSQANDVGAALSGHAEKVNTALAGNTQIVADALASSSDRFNDALTQTSDRVDNVLSHTSSKVQEVMSLTSGNVTNALNTATDSVADAIAASTGSVRNALDETTANVQRTLDQTAESLRDTLDAATGSMRNMAETSTGSVRNALDETTASIQRTLDQTAGNLRETMDSTTGSIRDVVASTADQVTAKLGDFRETADSQSLRASEALRAAQHAMIAEMQQALEDATKRFNDTAEAMRATAKEVGTELEATRSELQRGVIELPEETRASAAAMRRVVAEQIEALAELNAIVRAQPATHDLNDRRQPQPQRPVAPPPQPPRQDPPRQEAFRPEPPRETYRPEPVPQSAYRPEPVPQSTYRNEPVRSEPLRPEPVRQDQPSFRLAQQNPAPGHYQDLPAPQRLAPAPAPAPRPNPEQREPAHTPLQTPQTTMPPRGDEGGGWLRDVLRNATAKQAGSQQGNLSGLTEEIARSMDPNALADAWSRYQGGEQNVFSRRIYTLGGQGTYDEVRKKLQRDNDFARTAQAYMAEFEQLLKRAAAGEQPAAETREYLLSDRGKVYTMLAHASGRLA